MSLNLGNRNIDGLTTLENLTSIRTFIGKGDFNNDGWDDIISYDTNLFIFINNQDTTFTKIDVAQPIHGVHTEVVVITNDRRGYYCRNRWHSICLLKSNKPILHRRNNSNAAAKRSLYY